MGEGRNPLPQQMNYITFMLDDGSHIMTSKHSDFPVQKLIFYLDKKIGFHVFNKVKIDCKNGKFYIGKKKLTNVIIDKQIVRRKEYKCPT